MDCAHETISLLNILLALIFVYYFIVLLGFWGPLVAVLTRRKGLPLPPDLQDNDEKPLLYVVAPCRDGAESIPGLVECLRKQDYPSSRTRILILADNCADNSADVARSLEVEVYERHHSTIKTKGNAVNELLDRHLKQVSFDGLVILDIDARVDSHFLIRIAAYLRQGAMIVQGVLAGKNAMENTFARIGDASYAIIRLLQQGRSFLGLPPLVNGSGGVALARESLNRMGWQVCSGRNLSTDLYMSCCIYLKNIPARYAPDLDVTNDIPADINVIRIQRRRWAACAFESTIQYAWPLFRKGIGGDWLAFDGLFYVLWLPPLSVLFVIWGLFTLFIWAQSRTFIQLTGWAYVASALWFFHVIFYFLTLRTAKHPLNWRDCKGVFLFLIIRIRALAESFILTFSKGDRWIPTPHVINKETIEMKNKEKIGH